MASLMDDLIEVLGKEKALYEELVTLSGQMRDAIVASDVPTVDKVTGLEQDVTTDIQNLDRKRAEIMNSMALVMNKNADGLTVSAIVDTLEKQPELQTRLRDVRDGIKDVMQRLNRINAQNQALIKQSMELLEFDLNLYRSMRQAPETANYDRSAYSTGELLGGGGFDAKQ